MGCVCWDATCTCNLVSACFLWILFSVGRRTQASQRVDSIDIHSAASTDSLPTTPPECQGRIHLVLNANQCIQHHRARLVQIERVRLHFRFLRGRIGRPTVDVESLCSGLGGLRGLVDGGGVLGGDG